MLFLHEVHQVAGLQEDEFEAAFREGWMPTLAKDDDARLLWYANHAVGSGVSYNVITVTGAPRRRRRGSVWRSGSRVATSRTGCVESTSSATT